MARSNTKYSHEFRKAFLELFKEKRLNDEVESLNHFIDDQEKFKNEIDYDGEIPTVPYGTCYTWLQTDKYKKYNSLLDEKVGQTSKNEKEDEEVQKEDKKEEEKEEDEEVKIKEKIEELPRNETTNPDYKENLPVNTKKNKPQNNNKTNLLLMILGVGSLVTMGTVFYKNLKGGKQIVREDERTESRGNGPEYNLI